MLYFSYGSNMSTRRLLQRAPGASVFTTARLDAHALCFHMRGADGSAKCDAHFTGADGDAVFGVLWHLPAEQRAVLDTFEGLGQGYGAREIVVAGQDGRIYPAFTYYALLTEPGLKPYEWYKTHVLIGAQEHHLPDVYVDKIRQVEAFADADGVRHAREMALYGVFL